MFLVGTGLALAGAGVISASEVADPRPAGPAVKPVKPAEPACGDHGTSVQFFGTPSEAAAQAKKEQKLVFVLHVSGNFEDPRFT